MISELGNRILEFLRHQTEPVPGKKISMHCHVSLHTMTNEIAFLNEDLAEQGLQIRSHISKGYSLDVIDQEKADFFAVINFRRAKRFSYLDVDDNAKAFFIIRFLLCYQKTVTTDKMAEMMYVSKSTILREMPRIREFLEHYQLKIVTRRGLGIRIEGSEWHKRLCLVDLDKSYIVLSPADQAKETYFNAALLKDYDPTLREQLRQILFAVYQNHPEVSIPMMYTPRIVNSILFASTRAMNETELTFSARQIRMAKDQTIYPIAVEIYNHLPAILKNADKEILTLTLSMLMQTYRSPSAASVLSETELAEYREIVNDALAFIERRYEIRYLIDEQLISDLTWYLYSLHRSCVYETSFDAEGIVPALTGSLFTGQLCMEFARHISERFRITLQDTQVLYSYYAFSRCRFQNNTPLKKYRMLVASIYGDTCAKDLAVRIQSEYGKYIECIHTTSYVTSAIPFSGDYDVLVTDASSIPVTSENMKVISFDYLRNQSNEDAMRRFFNNERFGAALRYFPENHFIKCDFRNREELYETIHRVCHPEVDHDQFIQDLIDRDNMVTFERQNQCVLISPHTMKFTQPSFYLFVSEKPMNWKKSEALFFIYYDYGDGSREIIDGINELQKVLLDKPFSEVNQIISMNYEETINLLYLK